MREIEFRGKVINEIILNGRVVKEKDTWVYGGFTDNIGGTFILQPDSGYGFIQIKTNPETIGQYTGLKDTNGTKIFEGDIIDFSYDMYVGSFETYIAKGIIVFEEGAFYVSCLENENLTKDESYLLYSINLDEIAVIGNIVDNPELLEKGE